MVWSLIAGLASTPSVAESGLAFMAEERKKKKFDELQPRESSCEGASTLVMRAAPLASTSDSSYLVDPASSHMLVSKIKPCMSKYKQICTVKLRMAH